MLLIFHYKTRMESYDIHEFEKRGVQILAVSKDSVKSHKKFAEKFNLNFPLLSDESKETIKAYGAWGEKKFMGRTFDGVLRNTYLIGPSGTLRTDLPAHGSVSPHCSGSG